MDLIPASEYEECARRTKKFSIFVELKKRINDIYYPYYYFVSLTENGGKNDDFKYETDFFKIHDENVLQMKKARYSVKQRKLVIVE